MTIYLLRHGLATHSTTGYGDQLITASILPESIPVIKKTAEYLLDKQTDLNYSSEFLRCRQTVEIISMITGKQFLFDKRLNEYNAESFEQFKIRLQSFLEDIKQKQVESLLICTHGAVIAGIKHLMINKKLNEENLLDFPIPGVLTVLNQGTIQEINFNT